MDVGCVARLLSQTNKILTEVSSWIDWIARARRGATDRLRICLDRLASSRKGIEFVKTTSFSPESPMHLTADPDKTACVAQALTLTAP